MYNEAKDILLAEIETPGNFIRKTIQDFIDEIEASSRDAKRRMEYDRMERLRKEEDVQKMEEDRLERLRKEEDDRKMEEERLRKEKEDRLKKEEEERLERLRKEEAERKMEEERLSKEEEERLAKEMNDKKRRSEPTQRSRRVHRKLEECDDSMRILGDMKEFFAEKFEEIHGTHVLCSEILDSFAESQGASFSNVDKMLFVRHARQLFTTQWPNAKSSMHKKQRCYRHVCLKSK